MNMTKRNIEIKVRLSRKEAENLNKQVKKCRLSREAYLRHLITGEVPREAPPPEYFAFMREMHYVGHNLNQIAQKAHVLNVVDAKRYDEDSKRLDKLTRTEYDILKLLMEHPGEVYSPNQIYAKVWKDEPYGTENTVAVHIRHLREKVEINPAEPRYLKVIWGRGYKIDAE